MLWCLPSLLICGIQVSVGQIASFERDGDLDRVVVNSATVQVVRQHATEGRHSLKMVFAETEWPNVAWHPATPYDWDGVGGLAMDVTNPSAKPVTLGIRADDDAAADGWNHSRTCEVTISAHSRQSLAMAFGVDPMTFGMRALPLLKGVRSFSASGAGSFDAKHVIAFQLFLRKPDVVTTLFVDNIRTVPLPSMGEIVDRFGQYREADWPGKVKREAELRSRDAAENADLVRHKSRDRDRFGGWSDGPKLQASGFFRTAKRDGKWWLVDPDGRLFFSWGVDTITPDETTITTGRESMFSWLPDVRDPLHKLLGKVSGVHSGPVKEGSTFPFYRANLVRKYGEQSQAKWREKVLRRLPSWGFNTIGNWSDDSLVGNGRVPYVATGWVNGDFAHLRSGSDYWGQMPDPFDPKFGQSAEESLRGLTSKVRNDPWCIGYFVDNELSWAGDGPDGRYGLARGALSAEVTSPGRLAFVEQLKSKYASIEAINRAWGTAAPSWESLRMPDAMNEAMRSDASVFVKQLALRYFTTVRDVLKKADPEHLYLGCRFAWHGPEAEEAAGEVCDVVSFNIYAKRLDASWDRVAKLNKPCIIGEFHFGALDRGMFHPGLVSVPDQAARAAMYDDYVRSVLASPSFVGCHWFQYVDEPLTGRSWDGENYNIGFVTVTDTAYPEMVAAARKVHADGYRLRAGKP